jgi:hypothetical protein
MRCPPNTQSVADTAEPRGPGRDAPDCRLIQCLILKVSAPELPSPILMVRVRQKLPRKCLVYGVLILLPDLQISGTFSDNQISEVCPSEAVLNPTFRKSAPNLRHISLDFGTGSQALISEPKWWAVFIQPIPADKLKTMHPSVLLCPCSTRHSTNLDQQNIE